MISIDIHRQIFSKNWREFVLSPWGNYRELTVLKNVFYLNNKILYFRTQFLTTFCQQTLTKSTVN